MGTVAHGNLHIDALSRLGATVPKSLECVDLLSSLVCCEAGAASRKRTGRSMRSASS